jgi:hypothetical protein
VRRRSGRPRGGGRRHERPRSHPRRGARRTRAAGCAERAGGVRRARRELGDLDRPRPSARPHRPPRAPPGRARRRAAAVPGRARRRGRCWSAAGGAAREPLPRGRPPRAVTKSLQIAGVRARCAPATATTKEDPAMSSDTPPPASTGRATTRWRAPWPTTRGSSPRRPGGPASGGASAPGRPGTRRRGTGRRPRGGSSLAASSSAATAHGARLAARRSADPRAG